MSMTSRLITPARLTVPMALAGLGLYAIAILGYSPAADLSVALLHPDPASFGQIYVHYSLLPRLVVAVLAGAALAFAATIFQLLLKNPLAEPSTLGILSGAQLTITLVTLSTVTVSAVQRDIAALIGALAAVAIIVGLTRKPASRR